MKLKDSFITYENDRDDNILMDSASDFSGIVHSNRTAAFIIECLKTDTTESEIADKMMKKYDVNKDVVTEDIKRIIAKLKGIGAIDE